MRASQAASAHSTDAGSAATTESSGNAGSLALPPPLRRRSRAATLPSADGCSDSLADSVTVTLQGGGNSSVAGRSVESGAPAFAPPPSLAQLADLPPPQAGAIEGDGPDAPPPPPLPPVTESSQDDATSSALLPAASRGSDAPPARASLAQKGSWFKMFGAGRRGTAPEDAPPRHASAAGSVPSAAGDSHFEVAERRLGSQAVYNPNVLLNADDAAFLRDAASDGVGRGLRSAGSSIVQPASLGGAAGALPNADAELPVRPESRGGGSGGTGDGLGHVGVSTVAAAMLRQQSYNPQMVRPGDVSNGA